MKPSVNVAAWAVILVVAFLAKQELKGAVEALRAHDEEAKKEAATAALQISVLEAEVAQMRIKSQHSLIGTYRRVGLGSTGAETCADYGETCLGLRSSATSEARTKQFWGYSVGSCNSRVKVLQGCVPGLDFTLDNTDFRRHPESKVQGTNRGGPLCLQQPFYDFAVCLVVPEADPKTPPPN